ncbi:hypothetical protein AXF42_Ash013975 [Apostasia shenzhenica]|uniref:DUF8040 domain-containing protein n=1 Tax=Apostasia shenzhenica TaxID=1088818 RepID=A0A2I0ASD7_9ASPA|nr:hypothetical protein AXF42_Ash013975 [Apostasia shenzhenica]
MSSATFVQLKELMVTQGHITDSRNTSALEQLAMFMRVLTHSGSIVTSQNIFSTP